MPGRRGQDKEPQRDDHDHVAVALELAVVPEQQDRPREQDQPEHEPLGLLARQRRVDPVDHHQAEARQHGDQGEHVRVGPRQRDPDEDVRGDAQPEKQGPVGQRDVRERVLALDEDAGESSGDQQRGGDEPDQLTVSRPHISVTVGGPVGPKSHGEILPCSRSITRLVAFVCERRSLLSKSPRRAAGISDAGTPET